MAVGGEAADCAAPVGSPSTVQRPSELTHPAHLQGTELPRPLRAAPWLSAPSQRMEDLRQCLSCRSSHPSSPMLRPGWPPAGRRAATGEWLSPVCCGSPPHSVACDEVAARTAAVWKFRRHPAKPYNRAARDWSGAAPRQLRFGRAAQYLVYLGGLIPKRLVTASPSSINKEPP